MPDFIRSFDVRYITPAAALASGDLAIAADGKVGYVEAQRGIPANQRGIIRTSGLVDCLKVNASDVIAAGDRIQYNTSTKLASVLDFGQPASGSIVIGIAAEASANGVPMVRVDLNSHGGTPAVFDEVKHIRTRLAAAAIDAGATLLPAIAGYRYRIVDMAMIAIGGNAAGATSVDIRATQSTVVNLMASAVAGLTQNTLLRAGATNGAILAGGVSFVANDANTAITANRTGSNLTGATSVDFLVSYAIEPA